MPLLDAILEKVKINIFPRILKSAFSSRGTILS